jgi:gem associated protein 5
LIEPFAKQLKHSDTKVKSEITSIAVTQFQEQDYIAVGYSNGMIFVERIRADLSMETVFQIANENDPIQSLDWQRLVSSEDWPLLASSTKRKRNITIWKFPSQSKMTSIRLPNPPAQATEQQKSTVWVELAWSPQQSNKLYFSSYIGSIICFEITNKGPKICNNERLEKHNRNVFTINWFNEGRNCITTSLDKQVIKWDVKKKMVLQSLKTQTGYPYALDIPEWNEGQLAVGMGDNSIKLWNFSDSGSIMKANRYHDYYEASVLWKGLQGKIEKVKADRVVIQDSMTNMY